MVSLLHGCRSCILMALLHPLLATMSTEKLQLLAAFPLGVNFFWGCHGSCVADKSQDGDGGCLPTSENELRVSQQQLEASQRVAVEHAKGDRLHLALRDRRGEMLGEKDVVAQSVSKGVPSLTCDT